MLDDRFRETDRAFGVFVFIELFEVEIVFEVDDLRKQLENAEGKVIESFIFVLSFADSRGFSNVESTLHVRKSCDFYVFAEVDEVGVEAVEHDGDDFFLEALEKDFVGDEIEGSINEGNIFNESQK